MIKVVTFPRSGHHWLMDLTQDACKLPCNWHKDLHLDTPGPDCLVAKSHDFALKESGAALIQWRDPVDAICSWYELGLKHGDWTESEYHFRQWSLSKMQFAAAFYRKWVQPMPADKVIKYEYLRRDPAAYVDLVADLIGKPVLRNVNTETTPEREQRDFRFYDKTFFRLLYDAFDALT